MFVLALNAIVALVVLGAVALIKFDNKIKLPVNENTADSEDVMLRLHLSV